MIVQNHTFNVIICPKESVRELGDLAVQQAECTQSAIKLKGEVEERIQANDRETETKKQLDSKLGACQEDIKQVSG